MTPRIHIGGLPSGRAPFAASPLAELTAMLHVLAEPGHHPRFAPRLGADAPTEVATSDSPRRESR